MFKIKIKQKGLFLKIPGLKEVRTPVTFEATEETYEKILNYLHNNSIEYSVIVGPGPPLIPLKGKTLSWLFMDESTTIENIEKFQPKIYNSKDEDILKKLKNIEDLVGILLSRDSVFIQMNEEEKAQRGSKRYDDERDDFIPSINVKDIVMDIEKIDVEDTSSKIAELLKQQKVGENKWMK